MELPLLETPALQELSTQPIWVAWKPEPRGNDKISKIPCDLLLRKLKWKDKNNLKTCDELANKATKIRGLGGLGVVFLSEGPYCGVDIDDCRNKDTGEVTPKALEFIKIFDSYTEISPSGTGVHILMKAKHNPELKNRHGIVEIYDHGRFFTVTGTHLDGTPETINERQEQLDYFIGRFWPKDEKVKSEETADESGLFYNPQAKPPLVKFDILQTNYPKFKASWEHIRTDLFDDSLSVYDASLCWFAIFDKWTKQETFDLIIAHHRKYAESMDKIDPAKRPDYFERTYKKSFIAVQHGRNDESLAIDRLKEEQPDYGLDLFFQKTGIRIKKVILRGQDPGKFFFQLEDKLVKIGTMRELMNMHNVRCILAEHTNIVFGISENAKIKQDLWYDICEWLLKIAVREDTQVLTERFQLLCFVKDYLEDKRAFEVQSWQDAAFDKKPFIREMGDYGEFLFINLQEFRRYLNFQCDIKTVNNKLTEDLKECNMEYKNVSFRQGEKNYCRGYWTISLEDLQNGTHVSHSGATWDGEDDLSGGAGDESGSGVRDKIDSDLQSH